MNFKRFSHPFLRTAAALSAFSAIAVAAPAAWAQTSAPMATSSKPATEASGSAVSSADRKMMVDIAQANMAEVAAGNIAMERSQSDDVKKFATQMVDDHGKALTDVQALATSKNVKLPDGPDAKHKTMAAGMKMLKGHTFDVQYAKRSGVDDHQATLALLKKTQAQASDADLKALAGKMQPVVEHHLMMAKELASATSAKK